MKTSYIRFYQAYEDPVWGMQTGENFPRTPLIRVTRNRLRKAVFEWVGGTPVTEEQLTYYRKHYPVVMREY